MKYWWSFSLTSNHIFQNLEKASKAVMNNTFIPQLDILAMSSKYSSNIKNKVDRHLRSMPSSKKCLGGGCLSLSQLSLGKRKETPWTGRQSITGQKGLNMFLKIYFDLIIIIIIVFHVLCIVFYYVFYVYVFLRFSSCDSLVDFSILFNIYSI